MLGRSTIVLRIPMSEHWWRTPLLKPRRLHMGDRVAIVTPGWGGPGTFPGRYEAGKSYLATAFGLDVIEMPNARRDAQFLYANPAARADDVMRAFADKSIAAVVASIGGDDAIRLIPHVDLAVIRDNPKIFLGYSDPTVLHFGCLKAGVGSFYGPTIMSGFAENGGMSALSERSFRQAAFEASPVGELPPNIEGWTVEHLSWGDPANQNRPRRRTPSQGIRTLRGAGTKRGRLIGGCAEVLEQLKGSAWWPPVSYWHGAILFYETSEEAPRETLVRRWLRNFAAQGILSRLAGIILARPGGAMNDHQRAAQCAAVLQALDEAGLADLPVLADLDFGHTDPIATLPYGVMAEIDCEAAALRILEAAVAD
jgi:muramoyltetrapeptide carboxypeptidase LdcA involved in peptidoglycan recycling